MRKQICCSFFLVLSSILSAQSFFEELIIPDTVSIKCMTINEQGDIFIGSGGNGSIGGVLRLMNGDTIWESICPYFSSSYPMEIEVSRDGIIYVGSNNPNHYLLKSSDNGQTWEDVSIPGSNNVVAILTHGEDSVIIGRNPSRPIVAYTIDGGDSWDCDTITSITNNFIRDFAISNNNEVYACMYCYTSNHGGIYKSADFGKTWKFDGLLNHQVNSISISPNGDIYTGDWSVVGSEISGIYCKLNDSTNYNYVMPASGVGDILIPEQNHFYVGNEFFMYRSINNGVTIDTIFDPLGLTMRHLCLNYEGYLLAANDIRIIKSKQPVILDVGTRENLIRKDVSLYPNPFNEKITITSDINAKIQKVTIFRPDGYIYFQSGYKLNLSEYFINTSGFESGIYFVLVECRNYVDVIKIIKL